MSDIKAVPTYVTRLCHKISVCDVIFKWYHKAFNILHNNGWYYKACHSNEWYHKSPDIEEHNGIIATLQNITDMWLNYDVTEWCHINPNIGDTCKKVLIFFRFCIHL